MDDINFGISNLGRLMEKSVPKGKTVLLKGDSGAGKTIACLKFTFRSVNDYGEPVVFVSFSDDKEGILKKAKGFGWNLKKFDKQNMVRIVTAFPGSKKLREWIGNFQGFRDELLENIDEIEAERVVIDGLEGLHRLCRDENSFISRLFSLIFELRDRKSVSLVTTSSDLEIENIVDGIIRLNLRRDGAGNRLRTIELTKMTGVKHSLNEFTYEITEEGLKAVEQADVEKEPQPEKTESKKNEEEMGEFLHSLLRHDIRNKAQIIMGYLELLKEEDLSKNGYEMVSKAVKATKECGGLINKISTLKGIKDEEIAEISLNPVLKNIISELEPKATENGIDIQFNGCRCKVWAGSLIEELFSNLISNSIQHSDGSKIVISIQEKDEAILVTVEDDGKGIPEDVEEKVFEKGFKKGESGGTGLGLYLVKKLVESYDGEIKDSELGGARFDIQLNKA